MLLAKSRFAIVHELSTVVETSSVPQFGLPGGEFSPTLLVQFCANLGKANGSGSEARIPSISPAGQEGQGCSKFSETKWKAAEVFFATKDMHDAGLCVPCLFYRTKTDACRKGDACSHCHFCTKQEAKARRRMLGCPLQSFRARCPSVGRFRIFVSPRTSGCAAGSAIFFRSRLVDRLTWQPEMGSKVLFR